MTALKGYLWQVNPGHHGQVVVFIVIANVERDLVQHTVVRVRLLQDDSCEQGHKKLAECCQDNVPVWADSRSVLRSIVHLMDANQRQRW
jgi:hypothetical protein